MPGPATGRRGRAMRLGALLPCLALIAPDGALAQAKIPDQVPAPGLLRPTQDILTSPLRGTSDAAADTSSEQADDEPPPAPPRIIQIPIDDHAAPSDAADTGFDVLNRNRKKPKRYPGQPEVKPPGPGSPLPLTPSLSAASPPPPIALPPSAAANKGPVPPAVAGIVDGQPPRKRLKADDDPFGAVGDYVGGFLVKSAVELSGGYDTNPPRVLVPQGSWFYVVAPEFLAISNWERHAVVADLRGSFTGYGTTYPSTIDGAISPAPTNVDRPDFTGHIDGRLDVTQDTQITSELRLRIAIDNPGSPNIQAGLAKYPIYTTLGGTFGLDQNFNRLNVAAGATIDRTVYQDSQLTDGTSTTNDDRNFTQTGGVGRVSYELSPAVKPFAEVEADGRVHDLQLDRFGYARDSTGGYAKAGTSFEFTRLLTGEISVGWAAREYVDNRLDRLQGLLTSASLVWSATPLTTAKFYSNTSIDETTLAGVSGVLTHIYAVEVDHDFRRWLTAIGKFSYSTLDYQGDDRNDKAYHVEGDLIYKLTRNFWIKGTLRRDWLDSNIAGASSASTVAMLGVRVQN